MQKSTSKWVKLAILLFLIFGFGFLPPFGEITQVGMRVLGIFLGALFGLIFIGMGYPQILAIIAFGLSGIMPMDDFLSKAFGSQVSIMCAMLILLSAYMEAEGLSEMVINFLLTRKIAKGRPYLTVFFFMLACFIGSSLGHCLPIVVLFMTFAKQIVDRTGMKYNSYQAGVLVMGIIVSSTFGDTALPYKATVLSTFGAFNAISGETMNLGAYTLWSMPMSILLMVVFILVCKYIMRIDMSALNSYEHTATVIDPKEMKRKRTGLVLLCVILLAIMLHDLLPEGLALNTLLDNLGYGGIALAGIAALLIIHSNGKPLMDFKAVAPHFNWGVYFLLMLLLTMMSCVTSDDAGIRATLVTAFTGITSGMSPVIFVIAIVVLCAVLTNLMNNIPVGVIFTTIGTTLGMTMPGVNTMLLAVLTAYGMAMSTVLPSASSINGVVFLDSNESGIAKTPLLIRLGLIVWIAMLVVLLTVGWAYAAVLF